MKQSLSIMDKKEKILGLVQEDAIVSSSDCMSLPTDSEVFTSAKTASHCETDEVTDESKLDSSKRLSCSLTSEEKYQSKICPRLVRHCGPECVMSQRIVDKLLSRMVSLENERSELHAANRSWSVQYKLMKEHYIQQIENLKEEVKNLKKEKKNFSAIKNSEENKLTKSCSALSTSDTKQDKLDLLTHQAQVYKEDFLEERKARARAHSQIEALKAELKRERKSRVKLAALVQQNPNLCEKSPTMISTNT